ncbi:RmlC-like cupin domain-containing protein [Penicillium verhagenii]|uniref:RmlC-like cupin domain-containing protein n=1 Tax=Penicillium verhagenii TaxID=1562060 RepID=UPI002545410A|nr:RmlC-like cupin domain-containing protein [Penicillium verhagenii]KAJ5915725.1 RmlC-like cupin domain-containing protein [Penicillium verhagenii]
MYSQTHFHSTTHEVLGIVAGRARLCFGGEGNPERFEPIVQSGDLIIVPAGVGHRLLTDEGDEPFLMVGSYPHNKEWDMCYGRADETGKVHDIQKLTWFDRDPLYGDDGSAVNI